MKNFKIILSVFVFLSTVSVCYADNVTVQGGVQKTINCQEIKSTDFAKQLKKVSTYKTPSYNLRSSDYSTSMEGMMMNSMMGGMMNAMTMGVVDNSYSADLVKKQQMEYAKQQAEYADKMDNEDSDKPKEGNKKGFWDKVIDGM